MCNGCSKEPCSFEYPQHMFWLRNKKIIFRYAPLSGGLLEYFNSSVLQNGEVRLLRFLSCYGVASPTGGGIRLNIYEGTWPLFFTVPWIGLQCVIVVFPDNTHFLTSNVIEMFILW